MHRTISALAVTGLGMLCAIAQAEEGASVPPPSAASSEHASPAETTPASASAPTMMGPLYSLLAAGQAKLAGELPDHLHLAAKAVV